MTALAVEEVCPAPRHGTYGATRAGCICPAARRAAYTYRKLYSIDAGHGHVRKVPILGTRRRVQALMRIGWPREEISYRLGYAQRTTVLKLINQDRCRATTAARVTALYRQLECTPGPSRRTAGRAALLGYPPPIAWDDIDDPDEQPKTDQMLCTVPACLSPMATRGLCVQHYLLSGLANPRSANGRKTQCRRGHKYDRAIARRGGIERRCSICENTAANAANAARRAARADSRAAS